MNPCTRICSPLPRLSATPPGWRFFPSRTGSGETDLRADDEIRTRDPHLGKVMLYQLSHVRIALLVLALSDRLVRRVENSSAPFPGMQNRPSPARFHAQTQPDDPAVRPRRHARALPTRTAGRAIRTCREAPDHHGRRRTHQEAPDATSNPGPTTPHDPRVRNLPRVPLNSCFARAIGAVVARFVHTEEVGGSKPPSPTLLPAEADPLHGSASARAR